MPEQFFFHCTEEGFDHSVLKFFYNFTVIFLMCVNEKCSISIGFEMGCVKIFVC